MQRMHAWLLFTSKLVDTARKPQTLLGVGLLPFVQLGLQEFAGYCQVFASIKQSTTYISSSRYISACAFITRDQPLSASEQLLAQTYSFKASQPPFSAQPGVVRSLTSIASDADVRSPVTSKSQLVCEVRGGIKPAYFTAWR